MLVTVVVAPEAFDHSHFASDGYRDQAEMLLRGLQSNGLLLVDPESRLLKELGARLANLSFKQGQQLQIRLADLQNTWKRVFPASRTVCKCPQGCQPLDAAVIVQKACNADALIVDEDSNTVLQADAALANRVTPLAAYISSPFERQRHQYHDQLPPIDKMAPGVFDQHMVRCTRFARRLRFYDKQIGHGSSLGGFRLGIGKIIGLWLANAHYPRSGLSVEIYTCVQKTHKSTSAIHTIIRDNLLRRLATDHAITMTLYFKEDAPTIAHDRYLQADSIAVNFSKGVDYVDEVKNKEKYHRCTVRIDNGATSHLDEYRQLKDHIPPTS